jgi:hypothetical protein
VNCSQQLPHYLKGKLFSTAASLLFLFSREILDWQNPPLAAALKLASVFTSARDYLASNGL